MDHNEERLLGTRACQTHCSMWEKGGSNVLRTPLKLSNLGPMGPADGR